MPRHMTVVRDKPIQDPLALIIGYGHPVTQARPIHIALPDLNLIPERRHVGFIHLALLHIAWLPKREGPSVVVLEAD